ncbi:MAG: methyltransferase domain-containing protein [Solirubrobacterales bacterium]|nr:methyltransferase domain-containing protein [Solirubrobacterales bacterium]
MSRPRRLLLGAVLAIAAAALWWRKNPSACPYGQRFWVQAPHPFITRARLREILEPVPGEHVLEVGPGTGYYTLDVAEWIGPDGAMHILDVQQEMLDHTMGRASERGLALSPLLADATQMPHEGASFDAAYLTTVLGEIPDQEAAIRELARVLRPGGRLIVGELLGDPHYVSFGALSEKASAAGLVFELRLGGFLGYFARFRKPGDATGEG